MAAVAILQQEAARAASALATRLSPSQVRTFSDCPARWYFKHALGMPDPKTGNQALGIAVHEAIAYAFEEKMDTRRNPDPRDAVAQFGVEFEAALEDAELREEESVGELALAGGTLVEKYVREAAPRIDPAAVELDLAGEIGGVSVAGIVDLVERNGRIRDLKTAQRKQSTVTSDHAFQLATYVELVKQARPTLQLPAPTGKTAIDSLVRTKTPQLIEITHTVDESDRAAIEKLYPLAQEAMRSGYYMPNRSSTFCSRRSCSFWRACEREYGGTIA